MTRPGSISTGRVPILPRMTIAAFCAQERKTLADRPRHHVLQHDIGAGLAGQPPHLLAELRSGAITISSAPTPRTAAAFRSELVTAMTRALNALAI